jgi:hypothetical protein
MLDQGCWGVPGMVMAEVMDGGNEDASHESQGSGQGNAPRPRGHRSLGVTVSHGDTPNQALAALRNHYMTTL